MIINKKALLAAAVGWAMLAPAGAVTIDFNDVPEDYGIPSYKEDGYVLTALPGTVLTTALSYQQTSPGSPARGILLSHGGAGEVAGFTLGNQDQRPFRLFSFNLGGQYSSVIDRLEVTGLRLNGETVQWTLLQPDMTVPKLYQPDHTDARWNDLVSVDFTTYGLHNRAVYDNIVLVDSVITVPEPSSLLSMLIGCAGLAFVSKRQARRAQSLD